MTVFLSPRHVDVKGSKLSNLFHNVFTGLPSKRDRPAFNFFFPTPSLLDLDQKSEDPTVFGDWNLGFADMSRWE